MSGRYKILEELGKGGAGSVCKAYDTQLDRYVALKRLLTKEEEDREDTQSSGLKKEAASLATLQHPNIVTIYDLGHDENGLFIVMELLEGDTLGDWIQGSTLNLPDFNELATQTLEAVLSAHAQSILHRDLKPENMKVKRLPGGRLQVKIVDFGLARLSYGAKKQTEDQRGHILGSIFYMAPEQFLRRPLDGRTDLYSLGCVYYQALTGRRPYQAHSVAEVMDLHLKHEVTLLHDLRPDLPSQLSDWVMWLMAREQGDRPASAQQALDTLRGLAAEGKLADTARPSTTSQPTAPTPVRPPTGAVRPKTDTVGMRTPPTISSLVPVRRPAPPISGGVRPSSGGLPQRPSIAQASGYMPGIPGAAVSVAPLENKKSFLFWVTVITGLLLVGGGAYLLLRKHDDGKTGLTLRAQDVNALPKQPPDIVKDEIMHFRAGVLCTAWNEDKKPTHDAQPGEPVMEWRDLSSRAGISVLAARDRKKDNCPQYAFGQPDGFKMKTGWLRFDPGDSLTHRMEKNRGEVKEYPFGEKLKQRGLTLSLIVRMHLTDKESRILVLRNQDGRGEMSLFAFPNNEFRCQVKVKGADGKENKGEGKVGGRNLKGYNLVTVTWNGDSSRATLSVRSQDGTKGRAEFATPKDCQVLNELRIGESGDGKTKLAVTDQFTGEIAELILWPFYMDWDPRSMQDQKLAEFYFSKPGKRFD